jgi:predicted TIM-barrel fold metal-dependent hydrolase
MLPPWLRLLDHNYTDVQFSAKLGDFRSHLSMSPSEYFARNVNVGASCIPRADLAYKDILGVDKMMWGSDYPHPEGTWPQTQQYYKDVFSGIAEDEGRKILGGNAIDWYGLDRQKLQSVADDIGPTTSIFN